MITRHFNPQARVEARRLVKEHDGKAEALVEDALQDRLERGDAEEALKLDQVRREIEHIYATEGK